MAIRKVPKAGCRILKSTLKPCCLWCFSHSDYVWTSVTLSAEIVSSRISAVIVISGQGPHADDATGVVTDAWACD